MPRLLVCHRCKTIDELPSLTRELEPGEAEPLLEKTMATKHNHGPIRIGGTDEEIALVTVDDLEWMRTEVRDEVLRRFRHRWSGFEPEVYHLRSTFHEDALRCYSNHFRPKEGCIDYHDDKKLLTPTSWKTDAEEQLDRSDLTRIQQEVRERRKPVYLCDFCPVQTWVTTQIRHKRGQYKKQPGESE